MADITNEIASRHLGKKSVGSEIYDPSLLVVVPRIENRKQYHIQNDNLPFIGYDIWHAYEFSCITENGIPLTRVLKLKYNCNNEFLIESKSLKLYLNSFNMSRFGESINDALKITKELIVKDLSEKLETKVEVEFLENKTKKVDIFENFQEVMSFVDEKNIKVESFKETPEYLKISENAEKTDFYLRFDSLRSNCRVTYQPDFGVAFIYYSSKKHIDESSLVQYLSSFRSEYHFHEECCEMIYKRLQNILNTDDELFVGCLYTRRGGIDICPMRWNPNTKIADLEKLLNLNIFARSGIMQ